MLDINVNKKKDKFIVVSNGRIIEGILCFFKWYKFYVMGFRNY